MVRILDDPFHDDTNRYATIGGGSVSYDASGNLTVDHRGYQYAYDYENRIVEIQDSGDTTVEEYDYDALSRRIRMVDNIASATTLYYYNDNWQVLQEYNAAGTTAQRYYVYGNYIDEVLLMNDGTDDYYYGHNHLYSPVALMEDDGDVVERYEYDAYGMAQVSTDSDTDGTWFDSSGGWDTGDTIYAESQYGSEYMFTGRRLDTLDSGDLSIMYYRNRYYDTETGRFLTHDPLGVNPSGGKDNNFNCTKQYKDGMNIYEYVVSNPILFEDPFGLDSPGCDGIPDGLESACMLQCCAKHDKCYKDNKCKSSSWKPCKGSKKCKKCNSDVFWCMLGCIFDWGDDPDEPNYYCAVHDYWFNDSSDPHMGHTATP